ncbi:MurR/RpiR family transcriptional regulator [Sediminispirochaeta bajacaliforniensis]|uniref:MurR/RpiR family transcriptional regulator n=1 Tax=Sediminispirochaeta bajacaliforniensis TaxID=148 RepID=UPI0003816743|nr:MurR/RpiR family transcriptional regulator [Sediminispirochaeta bajacaliforniensis]
MDILDTIRNRYPTFNKTQRRIADYLLQHPDTSCFSSLRQLAQNANTTEATILSFSRKLGYKSFLDLKSELQNYISMWMSPNEKIKTAIHQGKSSNDIHTEIVEAERNALVQTFNYISAKDFHAALRLLSEAKRVYVLSYDFANTVANLFAARFIRLGVDVVSLGSLSVPDTLYRLALCTPDDLIVLFSYAPYSLPPVKFARHLHAEGNKVLCFSDSVSCPIGQDADVILTSITNQTIFFNSMTAPASLVNLLASLFVLENKERFDAYKEKVDSLKTMIEDTHF